MDGTSYNAWRLTSLSTLPGWVLVLACAGLCAAIWLSFRGIRAEPSALRRRILLGLRIAAGALLLVLLLEPGVELRAESRVRARIALLLDTSRSMRFPAAPGGPSRAEAMLGWLKSRLPDLAALASRFQIDVYGFDQELQPPDADKLAAQVAQADQPAQGASTDILGALGGAAAAGTGGQPLAGPGGGGGRGRHPEPRGGGAPPAAAAVEKAEAPGFTRSLRAPARQD